MVMRFELADIKTGIGSIEIEAPADISATHTVRVTPTQYQSDEFVFRVFIGGVAVSDTVFAVELEPVSCAPGFETTSDGASVRHIAGILRWLCD